MKFKNMFLTLTILTASLLPLLAFAQDERKIELSGYAASIYTQELCTVLEHLARKKVNTHCIATHLAQLLPHKINSVSLEKTKEFLSKVSKATPKYFAYLFAQEHKEKVLRFIDKMNEGAKTRAAAEQAAVIIAQNLSVNVDAPCPPVEDTLREAVGFYFLLKTIHLKN